MQVLVAVDAPGVSIPARLPEGGYCWRIQVKPAAEPAEPGCRPGWCKRCSGIELHGIMFLPLAEVQGDVWSSITLFLNLFPNLAVHQTWRMYNMVCGKQINVRPRSLESSKAPLTQSRCRLVSVCIRTKDGKMAASPAVIVR